MAFPMVTWDEGPVSTSNKFTKQWRFWVHGKSLGLRAFDDVPHDGFRHEAGEGLYAHGQTAEPDAFSESF